jgi:transcriptional regulator with GAF, ATPase, and Fis domain
LRVALIVALSRNPSAEIVEKEDVQWAFDYIKSCVDRVFSDLKRTISGSDFEANKKEALSALRKLSPNGLSLKDMNKKQPFAKWNAKQRKEILDALEEAELAYKECTSTLGRTATVYFAKGD